MADDKTDLEKEFSQRLADARRQKAHVDQDLREGYFFTAPRRARDVSSSATPSEASREKDAGDLQISLGMEVAQDFATEMLNTFTPEVMKWAEQKAGVDIPEEAAEEINERISKQTDVIFDAIKASNFYSAASQAYVPDLSLGTVGLWVDDQRPAEPFHCQPVPVRELEINIGPNGKVDDRFIVRRTKYRHLPALLKGVELPAAVADKVKTKANEWCTVTWGWWRLWNKTEDVFWQAGVRVGEKIVSHAELRGEGSCPLIVKRFNPDSMFAWGDGPALQALPELRRLDEMEALDIESYDFRVHRPFFYSDDGVINFENGIEPGKGYKARPWGPSQPFVPMDFGSSTGSEEFKLDKVERRIKRLFFVDQPEQAGKTPPTAEQWMDEMQRAKRRIGTPGKTFFDEGPAEVFLRFKYLLEQRGTIEPVTVDGKTVSLTPYDPTEQAQEFQEVQTAGRILQMGQVNFAQIMPVVVDAIETLKNIKRKLRDNIVVIREPDQIAAAVQQLAPVLSGGDAPPQGGAPA